MATRTHRADHTTTPRSGPPGWLVPVAISAVAVGVLYWLRPSLVPSTVTSWRAWVFIALVAAAATLLPRIVRAAGGPGWLGRLAGILPIVAALTWAVLPAFRSTTVDDEPVPSAAGGAPATASSSPGGSPGGSPGASPAPAAAARSGTLRGIDHRASGRVRLIPVSGGSSVVRLENLDVEPGPDYLVYLVPGAGRESPAGGVQLAKLKANKGNQNYPVPRGTAVSGPLTVLIWCRAFSVPIAAATLS